MWEERIDCDHLYCSTIITIAHRLNTVLDYDRILVLKDGNLAEMDSPKQLMQTEGSIFRAMCQVRDFSLEKFYLKI